MPFNSDVAVSDEPATSEGLAICFGNALEIGAVARFAVLAGVLRKHVTRDKPFVVGYLLRARNLQALPALENFDELSGLEKAVVRAVFF